MFFEYMQTEMAKNKFLRIVSLPLSLSVQPCLAEGCNIPGTRKDDLHTHKNDQINDDLLNSWSYV